VSDQRSADEALLRQSGRAAEAAALARPQKRALDPVQAMMGLPPPVWMNDTGNKAPDGRCVLYSGSSRCQATATHRAWIGCTTGEHLDRSDVCAPHAAQMPDLPTLHCKRCWDAMSIISDARIIKIEEIGDDDDDAAAPGPSPDLLP
jgi:hypothetical protein